MKLPAKLDPSQVTAVIDSREQRPLDLSPLKSKVGTLDTGDYSARGLEHIVRIERKSLPDLIGCVGRDRDRFDREVQRLLAYPVRVLIVEATWHDIEAGNWRGKVASAAVQGSLLGWIASGLQVELIGTHERASMHVARLLFTIARRRWRELRAMAAEIDETDGR